MALQELGLRPMIWHVIVQWSATFNVKEPFWPLSYRIKSTWSHKIFDKIKITRHITKVLYSDVTGQRSSNHFRSEGDRNVKYSNNKYYNIYACIIDKINVLAQK